MFFTNIEIRKQMCQKEINYIKFWISPTLSLSTLKVNKQNCIFSQNNFNAYMYNCKFGYIFMCVFKNTTLYIFWIKLNYRIKYYLSSWWSCMKNFLYKNYFVIIFGCKSVLKVQGFYLPTLLKINENWNEYKK